MSIATTPRADPLGSSNTVWRTRRVAGLAAAVAALFVTIVLSLTIGSKPIHPGVVLDALFHPDPADNDHVIVRTLRVPRTALGLLAGSALGLAGAVMQGVTRNPLADPGILGVNAGAALAVVVGITVFGVVGGTGMVWWSLAGAAIAFAVVLTISASARAGATPVTLALAGAAVTAFLASITSAVLLTDAATLDRYRFWAAGSLSGRDSTVAVVVAPFIVVGAVAALASARSLDSLALGDDVARSLGLRVGLARVGAAVAVVALVGGATAAVGPIAFVGLAVPHVARSLAGNDHRWVLPLSAVLAPVMLLGSDVIGRVVALPGEVQVGIVTALVGAPVFIALVRRSSTVTS